LQADYFQIKKISTDLLIIGGGTAGTMAGIRAKEIDDEVDVLIVEKAHLQRSGCLAAGMNAINAYLNPGETPASFTDYVKNDAMGLCREDLVYTMAERLNQTVQKVESWGLPIQKNEDGDYQARGRWNIKIYGENLKPILADKAVEMNCEVLNRTVITDLIINSQKVVGAVGFNIRENIIYIMEAGAVIMAAGGAAGLYRPNNDGEAAHKMWYSPFNTGAGCAIGIRAGAEMTSLEMRFIALRIKDMIAPTGTLALGFGAEQVNSKGEKFMEEKYAEQGGHSAPTPLRTYAPVLEKKEGRGPVFMDTRGLSETKIKELKEAYLDMYPDLILYWSAENFDFENDMIEIEGTEPYVVGGHAQAGYWINRQRKTTCPGLFAAGDCAGGAPYKFVSGCWAEGEIAAENAVKFIKKIPKTKIEIEQTEELLERMLKPFHREEGIKADKMENRLQKIMDEYAGGISKYYEMNEKELELAIKKIKELKEDVQRLQAENLHELMLCHEVIDRIDLSYQLLHHLVYRKETRWPAYQTRTDYPHKDDQQWLKFINSRLEDDQVNIIERPYHQLMREEQK